MKNPDPETLKILQKWSDEVDKALFAGECPQCKGHSIVSEVDPRQNGKTSKPGIWIKYTCSKCGYICTCTRQQ